MPVHHTAQEETEGEMTRETKKGTKNEMECEKRMTWKYLLMFVVVWTRRRINRGKEENMRNKSDIKELKERFTFGNTYMQGLAFVA